MIYKSIYPFYLLAIAIAFSGCDFFFQDVEEERYTLEVQMNDPSMGTIQMDPDQEDYSYGDNVVITAIPNDGYEFVDWTVNGSGSYIYDNPYTHTIVENTTIDAYFEESALDYLFEDDFDPSTKYWLESEDGYGFRRYETAYIARGNNRIYNFKYDNPGYFRYSSIEVNQNIFSGDYFAMLIDFTTWELYDEYSWVGIIYNRIDSNNYNMLVLYNNGYYAIWNQVNGEWDENLLGAFVTDDLNFSSNDTNNQTDIYFEKDGSNYLIDVSNKDNDWKTLYEGTLDYESDMSGTSFGLAVSRGNYHFNYIGIASNNYNKQTIVLKPNNITEDEKTNPNNPRPGAY